MTNFSGKKLHMEHFTGTTDSSGDLTVSLSATPANTAGQFIVHSNTLGVIPKVQTITGTSLVVRFYKFQYAKLSSTDTDADNIPSGVSAETSSNAQTSIGAGANGAVGAGVVGASDAHTHRFNKEYKHSHDISTFATTNNTSTGSETSVSLTVLYVVT